jgi:uncharacterized protein
LSVPRKLPVLDAETGFFWTAGADGRLLIQRCAGCDRWQHPPLPLCPGCQSEQVAPAPVSGRGTVKTFTVNHQAWLPGLDAPFVFAAIELVEQSELYVFSNVIAPVEAVRIGLPVSVRFEQQDDVWLPLFEPAGG